MILIHREQRETGGSCIAQVFKRRWVTSLGVPKTSNVYYCRFQLNGKDYLRSTAKTKRSEAVAEMHRMIEAAREGYSINRIMIQLRQALQELPTNIQDDARKDVVGCLFNELQKTLDALPAKTHEQFRKRFAQQLMQGIGEKLRIAETWEAWLKHPNKGNPSEKTLNGYKGQWNRFEKWAKAQKIEFMHEVSPSLAEKYTADLWGSGISPRTFNAHTKFLQSVFKALRLSASIADNPFDHIRKKEASTESRRSFTASELEMIFANAKGDLRYLVALGIFTGMRMGDCVNLEWEEVDFETGIITHIPSKTRRKGKVVRVPIHEILRPILSDLKEEVKGRYLFPALRNIYERDPSAISKKFTSFLHECGIETNEDASSTGVQRKMAIARVGFHSLRHSFVSLCAAEGVPQVALQELVGHGSPAMTAVYSHAGDEQMAKAIAALPSFGIENEEKKNHSTDE